MAEENQAEKPEIAAEQAPTPEEVAQARIAAAPSDEEIGKARDILARAQAAEDARIAAGPTDAEIAQANADLEAARARQQAAAVDIRGNVPSPPVASDHVHANDHSHGDA